MKPAPVVLITGAAAGIGHATALAFAQAGHCIVTIALQAERGTAVLVAR